MSVCRFSFDSFTMSNGLRVVVHKDESLPLAHVVSWYGVGTRDEGPGEREMAHLYEHMMFSSLEGVDDIHRLLLSAGADPSSGAADAGVSEDSTTYFTTVPKSSLETVLWLEAARMCQPMGDNCEEEFKTQLGVVKNEIFTRYRQDPFGRRNELIREGMFPSNHPYGNRTIGDRTDLSHITLSGLRAFGERYYHPANCVLVVAGDVHLDDVKLQVEKHFGPIPASAQMVRSGLWPCHLSSDCMTVVRGPLPIEQVFINWPSTHWMSEDEAAYWVLSDLLTASPDSLLAKKLINQGFALEARACQSSSDLAGTFGLFAVLRPGGNAEQIKTSCQFVLEKLASDGPERDLLSASKARIEFCWSRQMEPIGGGGRRAYEAAHCASVLNDPHKLNETFSAYREVEAEDIKRVATQLLESACFTLHFEKSSQMGCPKTKITTRPPIPEPQKQFPTFTPELPRKKTIDNGMQTVSVKRPSSPTLHVGLYVNVGSAADPRGKEGLSSLAAELLSQRSRILEGIGATVVPDFSPFLSGAIVSTTKEHLAKVLNTLAKTITDSKGEEEDFEAIKGRALAQLQRVSNNMIAASEFFFPAVLYGQGHPYAHLELGKATSVAKITYEDLSSFKREWWHPTALSLLVAGDVSIEEIEKEVTKSFSGMVAREATEAIEVPSFDNPTGLFGYEVKGLPQTAILLGSTLPPPMSKEHSSFAVAHNIVCGSFGSRLNMRLREELGYTYGVRSARVYKRGGGHWVCCFPVEKTKTKEALSEAISILSKCSVSAKDLEECKRVLPFNSLIRLQSTGVVGRSLRELLTLGLPLELWSKLFDTGADAQLDAVQDMLNSKFKPSKLTVALIGDLNAFEDDVNSLSLGKLERVTAPF